MELLRSRSLWTESAPAPDPVTDPPLLSRSLESLLVGEACSPVELLDPAECTRWMAGGGGGGGFCFDPTDCDRVTGADPNDPDPEPNLDLPPAGWSCRAVRSVELTLFEEGGDVDLDRDSSRSGAESCPSATLSSPSAVSNKMAAAADGLLIESGGNERPVSASTLS